MSASLDIWSPRYRSWVLTTNQIEAAREGGAGITKEKYPKLWAYIDLLHENEAYKRCVEKIKAIEGEFKLIP